MDTTKPGYATTEFWITLITQAAAVLALLHPGFNVATWVQPLAVIAAAGGGAFYAHSRGTVKAAAVGGQAAVANFRADLAVLSQAMPPARSTTSKR